MRNRAKKVVRYSDEFRNKALAKLAAKGSSLKQVAKEMGVSVPSLVNWKREARKSKAALGEGGKHVTLNPADPKSVSLELTRLRLELEKIREERDRLRKSIGALIGM